jgi:transketolase
MAIGDRPVALVLSKQATPVLTGTGPGARDGVARGGYVLVEPPADPRAIIIATGSEVALAVAAHEILAARDVPVRVVSLPSWALFADQDRAYRDRVLPPAITARVAVEQASALGWERFTGDHGTIIGMTSFGASGPGDDVRSHFGFTPVAIAEAVLHTIEHRRSSAQ